MTAPNPALGLVRALLRNSAVSSLRPVWGVIGDAPATGVAGSVLRRRVHWLADDVPEHSGIGGSEQDLAHGPRTPAAGAEARARRSDSNRPRQLGCGLILAGLLVLLGSIAFPAGQLVWHVLSMRSHLRYVDQLVQGGAGALASADPEDAGLHLDGLRLDLAGMREAMGPLLPIGIPMGRLPGFGGDLEATSHLLEVATQVVAAGDRTFQALLPALDLIEPQPASTPPGESLGERLFLVLVQARSELELARRELSAASAARSRIDTSRLSPTVWGYVEKLDHYTSLLETAIDGVLLAGPLLGADGPRTYLILAQNNDELRATGGFVSGVGELHVESGRIVSVAFSDSYAVDNLEVPHDVAPDALQKALAGDLWFFRDANWNADYRTSARRAVEIYARDRGVEADGVVALDLNALRLLLDAVGPLHIEGVQGSVTGQNVVAVLRAQWASPSEGPALGPGWNPDWWEHRKDFMGEVAGAALARLITGEEIDTSLLVSALTQALEEKHLLIYLADPEGAALLRDMNWDGALPDPSASRDLLLVVDSNVGFNKVDVNVERTIDYRIDLGATGGPEAHLKITYRNTTQRPVGACLQEARYGEDYAEMTERCYWDYVRVYVLPGSTLLTGPNLGLPPGSLLAQGEVRASETVSPTLSEDGLAVWAAFFVLEPMDRRVLDFTYRLPSQVLEYLPDGTVRYRLVVLKQPGTESVRFWLETVLPPGAVIVGAMPPRLVDRQRISTSLRTDTEFEIVYRDTGNQ